MYYKQGEDENVLRAIFGLRKPGNFENTKVQNYQIENRQKAEDYLLPRNGSCDNFTSNDFFNDLFKMNSNVFMK